MDFFTFLPKEWLGFEAWSTRVFYIELQLNKVEYQLKPRNTCTQHKYVLIQYSMYVDIYGYICIYMYMLHYKESAIQGFSNARILLPPPSLETSAH